MTALRQELQDFLGAISTAPSFEAAPPAGEDLVEGFKRIVREYRRHMMDWRLTVLSAVSKLEHVLSVAQDAGDDVLRVVFAELMPPIKLALDDAMERAQRSAVIPAETKRDMEFAVWADPSLAPLVETTTRLFLRGANIYVESLADVCERVRMLEWDYDPDARGGQSFDNADDLLASLSA